MAGGKAQGHHVRLGRDPPFHAQMGSLEFSKLLLTEAKVAVSPGIGFGECGDRHVRFALVENEHRIRQAIRGIKKILTSMKEIKIGLIGFGTVGAGVVRILQANASLIEQRLGRTDASAQGLPT